MKNDFGDSIVDWTQLKKISEPEYLNKKELANFSARRKKNSKQLRYMLITLKDAILQLHFINHAVAAAEAKSHQS